MKFPLTLLTNKLNGCGANNFMVECLFYKTQGQFKKKKTSLNGIF